MSFNDRSEFIQAQASEKLTIAHVHATNRLVNWSLFSGAIYSKVVPYFAVDLKQKTTELTQVFSFGSIVEGSWLYETDTSTLYTWLPSSVDPATQEMVVTYRFFWATGPSTLSWDLTDTGDHVFYNGLIKDAPSFKHKVGIDQKLVSVIGQGDLKLQNNDGNLDEVYDTLFFENQIVEIYSWNRDLPFSESRIIYRGRITNKRFNSTEVVFKVKDMLYDLLQNVPQIPYDDTDNVNDAVRGTYKRWVYGRVDGLHLQSLDQIGEGYEITGTVTSATPIKEITKFTGFPAGSTLEGKYFYINNGSDDNQYYYYYKYSGSPPTVDPEIPNKTGISITVTAGDNANTVTEKTSVKLANNFTILDGSGFFQTENTKFGNSTDASDVDTGITITTTTQGVAEEQINGTSTLFLSETSPGDSITIGTQEFTIDRVVNDTELELSDAPDFGFIAKAAILSPSIPTTNKNRDFFVAGHATARLTKTVVSVTQLNRIVLNDTNGLNEGDFVEFDSGERVEIKNVAPGNIIVLRQNIIIKPTVSSDVIRQPIQDVFIKSELVSNEKYTISNTGGSTKETTITLDDDVEFEIALTKSIGFSGVWTNGSRDVTTTDDVNLTEILSPRDWIRPTDISFTTFYEILSVSEQSLELRVVFGDPNHTGAVQGKRPDYIGDDTIVSSNVLGKTVDGEPDGTWIETGATAVRDLLSEVNITNINEASFVDSSVINSELLSLTIPLIKEGAQVSTKNIVDRISKSITSALTLDNNLDLQYVNLLPKIPDNPALIQDKDVIEWSIQSVNGDLIRNGLVRYRHRDVDRYTQEPGSSIETHSSEFVETYIGTNTSAELDVYLYNQSSAIVMAQRDVYFRSLARAEIRILTDLRFEDLDIGDHVIVDFNRLYKRFGDSTTRKKIGVVIGKTVNGQKVELFLSDLANIPNRTAIIAPNTTNEFNSATEDEKLKYGFITDDRGIVDDDEDTQNINLIS